MLFTTDQQLKQQVELHNVLDTIHYMKKLAPLKIYHKTFCLVNKINPLIFVFKNQGIIYSNAEMALIESIS